MTETAAPLADPISVLVVDDAEDLRSLLRLVLERDSGFVVAGEAVDGRTAVELAAQHQPTWCSSTSRCPCWMDCRRCR